MSTLRVNTIQNAAGSGDPTLNGTAKAWVNFNGQGTVAIRASMNVSSISDNGTGNYTVNFISPLQDTKYNAVVGMQRIGTSDFSNLGFNRSTTSDQIETWSGGGLQDSACVSVSYFR